MLYKIIFCLFCVSLWQPVHAQQPTAVVTAIGVCLATLDLQIRSHVISQPLDSPERYPILLMNTWELYKDLITNIHPPIQLQIIQAYIEIKQEFARSLISLEDALLWEFLKNFHAISQECVDAVSYQSGNVE